MYTTKFATKLRYATDVRFVRWVSLLEV